MRFSNSVATSLLKSCIRLLEVSKFGRGFQGRLLAVFKFGGGVFVKKLYSAAGGFQIRARFSNSGTCRRGPEIRAEVRSQMKHSGRSGLRIS